MTEYPNGFCISCAYFELLSEKSIRGLCRKRAPIPILNIRGEAAWPEVKINDLCGEYEKYE